MSINKFTFLRIMNVLAFLVFLFGLPQMASAHSKVTHPFHNLSTQSGLTVNLSLTTLLLAAAAGLLFIAIIFLIIMAISGSHRKDESGGVSWKAPLRSPVAGAEVSTKPRPMEAVVPIPARAGNPLGALTILFSDDLAMINQRIEMDLPVTHLGRTADNDIIFVKDSPVSRHHAVIESRNGQIYLSEVVVHDDVTGQDKRPAYGTFVNGLQLKGPVLLKDGDEIILGKRLRMRFEVVQEALAGDERTVDHIEAGADDRTVAAYSGEPPTPSNTERNPFISGVGNEAMPSGTNESTIFGSTADKADLSSEDDTLVSRLRNKPKLPGQEDETMPTGGGSG